MELHEAARQVLDAKEQNQRIKVSISQLDYEIKMLRISHEQEQEELETRLAEYNHRLADQHQGLTDVTSAASADITTPLRGKLGFSSVILGDAVKQGDMLGIVVPDGAQPTITLNLPFAAIGEIQLGQLVKIRVSSFPWRRYGKLVAKVKTISPAAVSTEKGMYFSITAEPEDNHGFTLQHGMEVTANITTDSKRVYQWLFNFIAVQWKK